LEFEEETARTGGDSGGCLSIVSIVKQKKRKAAV